jgi:hypothetical protein
LINYDQLTPEVLIEAVEFFGVELSTEDADAIRRVSRLYSKDLTQSQTFQSDSDDKKASASTYVLEMAQKWALPSFERLNLR